MSTEQTTNEAGNTQPAADYGVFLLAIPVVATMLIWFWVANMNLFQKPGDTLTLIMLATVIGTAIVAAMEANKLGMVTNRDKGSYSSTAWFFIISLLWFVGYPAYLLKRKDYGLTNRLIAGIAVTVIFIGSYVIMSAAIDHKINEVRSSLGLSQQTNSVNTSQNDRRAMKSHLQYIKMYMEAFFADNGRYPSADELNNMPEAQDDISQLLAISEVEIDSSNLNQTYLITATSKNNPSVVVTIQP